MAKAKRKRAPIAKEPEYKCLRCKNIMEKVESTPATNVVVHVPWRMFKHARAYVCPECGFVELYAK